MRKKIALVTGSAGLIGSQACDFLHKKGYMIIGIDNDMRSYFFGKEASTKKSNKSLMEKLVSENDTGRIGSDYIFYSMDIRNQKRIDSVFQSYGQQIEIVIHTAAQPSHDWAAKEPLTDFTINALGTMNLLEATRLHCPKATFIFTSTNKVYGDRPNWSYENNLPDPDYNGLVIKELDTRYEGFADLYADGDHWLMAIDEMMSIDNTKHSIFGASKVAADVMCQEYGKYFGMNVGIFRGGCLTGPNHAGTELHGFLSYLVKCIIHDKPYTIFGDGKQVRDNIHSLDLINMFWEFHQNPRPGEVYNAGGGRENSISILEAIEYTNELRLTNGLEKWTNYTINKDKWRIGDHIWYISDLSKFKSHYPNWKGITISVKEIIDQIYKRENE